MASLEVLYEDNHLLVVNKPAGIATMGAEQGATMHSMAAHYLKTTYQKPGKAFVGVVSRLDAMTSGVLVLAKTSKAASRLSAQFADRSGGQSEKLYLALVEGSLCAPQQERPAREQTEQQRGGQEWVDFVRKDDAAHRMRVVRRSSPGAKEARLRYHHLASATEWSLVAVRLISGRKHQIRLQFAHRGHAVLGDRKYGSRLPFPQGIALHSWRLKIMHPTRRVAMWFRADPPTAWKALLAQLPNGHRIRSDPTLECDVDASLQIDPEDCE
jgi:23S rRNA pseudouridine1911/1915/1917 synthase